MAHPPRIPVSLRAEQAVIYFVTLCVSRAEPALANEQTLTALRSAAGRLTQWKIVAATIMPDHLHLIITPTNDRDANVSDCSAALKPMDTTRAEGFVALATGCFDRLLRTDESAAKQVALCAGKPGPRRAGEALARLALSIRN